MKTPILLTLTLLIFSVFNAQARTVSLSNYATPNDGIDDSASFQAAANDVAVSGGGTLIIGEGTWDLMRPVDLRNLATNVTSIRIAGNKGAILRLDMSEESVAIAVGNAVQVEFSDLVVIPRDMGHDYDAGYFLTSNYTGQTIIQKCNFFGIRVKYDFIRTSNTDLIVEKTIFGGNAATGAQIRSVNYGGVTIRDSQFLDYANHTGTYYSKTPSNSGMWIRVENDSMPVASGNGSKAVTIAGSRFDEGAPAAIYLRNVPYADISDIQVNISGVSNSTAILLDKVKYAQIKFSGFGYVTSPRPAVIAINGSTVEAVGLRFALGVYFANIERSTKMYMEKCIECSATDFVKIIQPPSAVPREAESEIDTSALIKSPVRKGSF